MILSCNSCEKKFVVPDQAISDAGRTVQCGSCGNKWKQFPIKNEVKLTTVDDNLKIRKTANLSKTYKRKKKRAKKTREIDLYSPEYLEKKHGISLKTEINKKNSGEKVSFGFYNTLILLTVIIITLSKSLHFFQSFIIEKMPFTEFYISYYFENIKNIFEIFKNLISSY
tara:strand:+ start:140 stop:646 length:507 start_codon:yes stop_codon:yes gene_type:complete